MGKFQISQAYKGIAHDGLDLVGIDSKEIHATATGEVVFAGWENPSNHSQGFGQYVVILADGRYYHYGHLSEIKVSVGQQVRCTDVIGIEGSTGRSTGNHCHYIVGNMDCSASLIILQTIGTSVISFFHDQTSSYFGYSCSSLYHRNFFLPSIYLWLIARTLYSTAPENPYTVYCLLPV